MQGSFVAHVHFDVNKTIIMSDAGSGQTLEMSLQNILAENALGKVDDKSKTWRYCDDGGGDVFYADFTRMYCGKEEAKHLRSTFCEEGHAGWPLRQRYELLLRRVQEQGYFVRSFVRCMEWLKCMREEGQISDFRIYIRTFGQDLDHLVPQFNTMCDALSLVDKKIDSSTSRGAFQRASRVHSDLQLPHKTLSGYRAICDFFNDGATHTLALREDYSFWRDNELHRHAGKLLFVDNDHKRRHIFFDDNCYGRHDSNIVDVRQGDDYTTPVADGDARDTYFVEVNPLEAIEQENYFVRHLERILFSK